MLAVLMLVVAVCAAAIAWFAWPSPQPVAAAPVAHAGEGAEESASETAKLAVSVVGDVAEPGLVEIPAGSRVADAIEAAGGLKDDADAGYLNLARKVSDGELVVVEDGQQADSDASDEEPTDNDGGDAADGGPVNINEATEQELTSVTGIGPVMAKNIVQYRQSNGGFDSTEELAEVDGIGPATLEKIADQVTV